MSKQYNKSQKKQRRLKRIRRLKTHGKKAAPQAPAAS
jgi:hypothetical protein